MSTVKIGVAPTKRGFLSMDEAKRQKDMFMAVVRSVNPGNVELVSIDNVCENGIAYRMEDIEPAVAALRGVDALFIPHCDFGEERVISEIAAALNVPTLLWGNRDERPNLPGQRGRDTQCGMFACSKVLLRRGVKFSYIFNCETENPEFRDGFDNFTRVASALKAIKGLRIAKIGARPSSFLSVISNEALLLSKLGILTVPISPLEVADLALELISKKDDEYTAYHAEATSRISFSSMPVETAQKLTALVIAIKRLMEKNNCSAGALECWSAFGGIASIGLTPCLAVGELADMRLPLSCECDVNGAVTLAMMQALSFGEDSPFFADLTIRHPSNDNAELLWHCGPFPYSLKDKDCPAVMDESNEHWQLKKGDITIGRFDDLDGKFYLFAGQGRAVDGPETTGTYVWFETGNWKQWEERLIFGPYIHHVVGIYGKYQKALREVSRYIGGTVFDSPHSDH